MWMSFGEGKYWVARLLLGLDLCWKPPLVSKQSCSSTKSCVTASMPLLVKPILWRYVPLATLVLMARCSNEKALKMRLVKIRRSWFCRGTRYFNPSCFINFGVNSSTRLDSGLPSCLLLGKWYLIGALDVSMSGLPPAMMISATCWGDAVIFIISF